MTTIEINTTEGGRLSWVAIYQDTNQERAIEWGTRLIAGFWSDDPKPSLRMLDAPLGKVIGAWQDYIYREAAA